MDKDYIISALGINISCPKDKMLLKALMHILDSEPEIVENWIETAEGEMKYNNFLSESEAVDIVSGFKNASGSTGATWSYNEIKNAIERSGIKFEEAPYFNSYALYAAINMFVSDQYKTLQKWAGNSENKMFEMCYDLAYNQLKDVDKPNWIRFYFGL